MAELPDTPETTGETPTAACVAEVAPDVAALDVREISHRFRRGILAVDGVSLQVDAGEVFGLVGPDGAGKSTLIRMLATVLAPTGGDAFVFGRSVIQCANEVKPRIGYMSQAFSLYPDLTVAENLAFFATLRGVPRRDVPARSKRLLEFAGLTEFASRQAQYLSGGMKQKLALAATLIHEPDLLFLDEPTTGVDPVSRREFWRIIAGLHQRGITVFVATPYMDEAERCSHVAFMESGHILLSDTPSGLKASVPGELFEVDTPEQRRAIGVLTREPWVTTATVYGDVVRVVVEPGTDMTSVARSLASADLTVNRIEPARMDMETTFAFLADEARRATSAVDEEVEE